MRDFACQNGVTRMIPTVPDTVETSSNLAIITIGGGKAAIKILARSSCDSMKEYLTTSLESCFSMAGMKVEMTGGYSGWQPDVNSPILQAMKSSYKQQFGVEPRSESYPCRLGVWYYRCYYSGIGYDFLWSYITLAALTGRKSADSYRTEVL